MSLLAHAREADGRAAYIRARSILRGLGILPRSASPSSCSNSFSFLRMSINPTSSFNASYASAPSGLAPPSHSPPPLSPDRALRIARATAYKHQMWWLIARFIALIAVFQSLSWAFTRLSSRSSSQPKKPADAEVGHAPPSSPRRFSWRNAPSAIVNLYRVVAFRWTLEVGQSYTLNLAEVFVTCGYIVALFTWEFVNSESYILLLASTWLTKFILATNTEGTRFDPSFWTNRAGVLAVSQFPLVTALGTKNNVVACE